MAVYINRHCWRKHLYDYCCNMWVSVSCQPIHCRGCNKELLDKDSATPLLLSVKSGKANAVQALIDGGCDVNTKDRDSKTTVYWAAEEGHVEVLRVSTLLALVSI